MDGTHILFKERDALIQPSEHSHEGITGDRQSWWVELGTHPLQLIEVGQLIGDTLCYIHQAKLRKSITKNTLVEMTVVTKIAKRPYCKRPWFLTWVVQNNKQTVWHTCTETDKQTDGYIASLEILSLWHLLRLVRTRSRNITRTLYLQGAT